MEAELISSVVENLNNTNHECLCNCAPPPLFWYNITRPQVVGSCRKSKIKLTKKTLQESVAKASEGSDTIEEVLMINASPETGHEKMGGYNDAGLARIIDREMKIIDREIKLTTEMKLSERPVNPTPAEISLTTEISLKVDASTQVETIVCKSKIKLPQKQIPVVVEVSHKYVQTMDLDIFRPKTDAQYEQDAQTDQQILCPPKVAQYEEPDQTDQSKPSDAASVDEPEEAPVADTVECEVVPAVDWSQFTQVPTTCHSSTDWLNTEIDGRGEPDYDTEWSELTNYQAIGCKESVFNWLSADIVSEKDKWLSAGIVSEADKWLSPDLVSEADKCVRPLDDFDTASIQPPEDFHDYYDGDDFDLASIQPPEDPHDDELHEGDGLDTVSSYSCADWTDEETMSRETPARMMTPDMEDVLIGCEEPSILLDGDVVDELLVLQWNPIVVAPDTEDAEVRQLK